MRHRKIKIMLGCAALVFLLLGCGWQGAEGTMTPTPTSVPTSAPTQEVTTAPTPTEELTSTPTPTETPIVTPTPTATETPIPTPTAAGYTFREVDEKTYYTTGNLNMRSTPDTTGKILATAPKGSGVRILRQCVETGWYEVEYDGKTGYMSNSYLTETPPPTPTPVPTIPPKGERENYLIVLDPGHQSKGNYETEPLGPGSTEMKAKVSSGTYGNYSKTWEYQLVLKVSFYIREELEARGYTVVMTRESHDIDISNAERAQIANELDADAFIRVHANSSDKESVNGVETICQTKDNPYNAYLYSESKRLSELVLEEVVAQTGAKKRYIWETDTMTGINWTTVPTTILEMGYMSNKEEDERMATEEYQRKIAKGVADAIDRYFGRETE